MHAVVKHRVQSEARTDRSKPTINFAVTAVVVVVFCVFILLSVLYVQQCYIKYV